MLFGLFRLLMLFMLIRLIRLIRLIWLLRSMRLLRLLRLMRLMRLMRLIRLIRLIRLFFFCRRVFVFLCVWCVCGVCGVCGWVEWVFFSHLHSFLASFRLLVLACVVPLPDVSRSLIQELLESFVVFLNSGFCFFLVRSLAWRVSASTPNLGTATRTERLRVSLSNRSCGPTFAFKNQGACLSSLGSEAPEWSSTVHESHIVHTGLWTAQRSDVDSPACFVTSQLTL